MIKKLFVIIFVLFISESCFSDGLDSNVVLLLHADNVGDGNFIDSSFSNKQVNSVGGIVASEIAKFGLGSIYFNGFLTVPDSDDWSFGLGDFTIDFWIRFTYSTTPDVFLHQESDALNMWYLYHNGTAQVLEFHNVAGGVPTINHMVPWTASPDSWYHIAVIRFGNEFKTFIDGTQVGATTVDSDGWNNNTGFLYIGANAAGSHMVAGNVDELRISKGIARWTGNFMPPTGPYSIPTPTPTPTSTPTPDQGTSTAVPTSANVDTGGLSLITASVLGFFGIVWGIRKLILLLNRT